jgi:hypothetical protein
MTRLGLLGQVLKRRRKAIAKREIDRLRPASLPENQEVEAFTEFLFKTERL